MSILESVVVGGLVLAGLVFCASALITWRWPSAPATSEFATVVAVAGVSVLVVAAAVSNGGASTVGTAVAVAFLLPIPWLLFAFEYTGRRQLVKPVTVAILSAPIVLGLFSTVGIHSSWLAQSSQGLVGEVVTATVYMLTIMEGMILLYAGGVMLIGTGILLWTFHQYEHLDSTSGMLFGVFGSVPWLSLLFGFQVNSINSLALPATAAVGFLVGAGSVAMVVQRRQAFQRLPAAGNIGPETVIAELSDIVIVTDGEGTVIDINEAAERMLVTSELDILGSDVTTLLGRTPQELETGDVVEILSSEGRRLFAPALSELTDQHQNRLGYAVVLRNVTERTIREQRLEVLNRVLRHNLRNDTTILMGYGEILSDGVDDPHLVNAAESLVTTSKELADLADGAQKIDTLLATADTDTAAVSLAEMVQSVLDTVPDTTTSDYDVPEELLVDVSEDLLQMALTAAVENAVEHNDARTPRVTVRANYQPDDAYPVTLAVFDNGPGVPAMERDVIVEGTETPLHHGDGLGLWLMRWAVTRLGGDLDIRDNEPRGTVISIGLPNARRVMSDE